MLYRILQRKCACSVILTCSKVESILCSDELYKAITAFFPPNSSNGINTPLDEWIIPAFTWGSLPYQIIRSSDKTAILQKACNYEAEAATCFHHFLPHDFCGIMKLLVTIKFVSLIYFTRVILECQQRNAYHTYQDYPETQHRQCILCNIALPSQHSKQNDTLLTLQILFTKYWG